MQAQSNALTRRTKVAKKGFTGIYSRDTAEGRRYEITYLDRVKVRRWETVDGNLEDAAERLATRKGEVRENRHVGHMDRFTFSRGSGVTSLLEQSIGRVPPRQTRSRRQATRLPPTCQGRCSRELAFTRK